MIRNKSEYDSYSFILIDSHMRSENRKEKYFVQHLLAWNTEPMIYHVSPLSFGKVPIIATNDILF